MSDNDDPQTALVKKLESVRVKNNMPAFGAAISHDILNIVAVTGTTKFDSTILAQHTHQFHMGSCSKAVTALLIHQLAQQYDISLTMPLSGILTEFDLHHDYAGITLNNILTHSAGLPENIDQSNLPHIGMGDPLTALRKSLVQAVLRQPQTTPQDQFVYSNVGYIVLGVIVSELTGQSYESIVQDTIFQPLSMSSAEFYSASKNKPWAHSLSHDKVVAVQDDNHPINNPAGCIISNLSDWVKFLQYTSQHQYDQDIYQVSIGADTTYSSYGFVNKNGILLHHGSNTLNQACVRIIPKENVFVVVATNIGNEKAEAATESMANTLSQDFVSLC